MEQQSSGGSSFRGAQKETWKQVAILSFQSLGVVYGRISTAPLFVFGTMEREDFASGDVAYEYLSFIFWTLTLISLLKYAFIVLRADDGGEGGTFALYSLLCRHAKVGLLPSERTTDEVVNVPPSPSKSKTESSRAMRALEKHRSSHYLMLFLALFGACMIINDGVFTPAISVLSASKQFEMSLIEITGSFHSTNTTAVSEALKKYVQVPSACVIQILLFTLQHYGTRKIGFLFAPVVTFWLLFNSGVGIYNIFSYDPKIVYAISPTYLIKFVKNINKRSWKSLSSILLCIAGSEAMFADLGHFSKKPIKITFAGFVYPSLLLCYAGQAAFISKNLNVNNFQHLSKSMPGHVRHFSVFLSLVAAVVGSQASITASFSIINQCLALHCFPSVKVKHTSDKIHGQVYIPDVNKVLMVLSLSATLIFRDIHRIGYATGMAVVSSMLVTTCLMSLVIVLYWGKNLFLSACFLMFFGLIEAVYLSPCLWYFKDGPWYLAILSGLFLTVMLSWHYGTVKKYEFDLQNKVSVEWLTELSPGLRISRVPGIGFIYTNIDSGIPTFFSHFVTNLPAFHEVLIFVSFKPLPLPYVPCGQRYLIGRVGNKEYKIYRCIVRYGYRDFVRDTHDFEEQILRSIGEFISVEENDLESGTCLSGKMLVLGGPTEDGTALLPVSNRDTHEISNDNEPSTSCPTDVSGMVVRRKKVQFVLPESSPNMALCVRNEVQDLVDARESGMTYFLGKPHLKVRNGSNIVKKVLIAIYVFLEKNSREATVALNIPHAALVEVGTVCKI